MDTVSPAARPPVFPAACPSRTVIDVLAGKWVLYVLGLLHAADRPLRFSEFKRSVEGISQKSLTKALRALERDGLIDRRVFPSVPPRVEYRLTSLGRQAGRLLVEVNDWAKTNADQIAQAREHFDSSASEDDASPQWTRRVVRDQP